MVGLIIIAEVRQANDWGVLVCLRQPFLDNPIAYILVSEKKENGSCLFH